MKRITHKNVLKIVYFIVELYNKTLEVYGSPYYNITRETKQSALGCPKYIMRKGLDYEENTFKKDHDNRYGSCTISINIHFSSRRSRR